MPGILRSKKKSNFEVPASLLRAGLVEETPGGMDNMKIIYILLVFSIISCTIAKKSSQKNKDAKDNYLITKIKRIDNWYA
ncbi:MAG: hypothetical protein NTW29_18055, partial [Bacteroidetes bacterium]|nr:hypothetical protein [Bacteroidota bacterium]